MEIVKGYKSTILNNSEVEYPLKDGLTLSVIQIKGIVGMLYQMMGVEIPDGKNYSVEVVRNGKGYRDVIEAVVMMNFEELTEVVKKRGIKNGSK